MTGISKASIVLGLSRKIDPPATFPGDLMHHADLNLPEFFSKLFRGTLDCDSDDSVADWP